jgi:sugar/nucleoside kinase (ribokinase family)
MRVMAIGTLGVDVLAVELPAIAAAGTVVYTPREIETRVGGHPIDVAIDLVRLGAQPDDVAIAAALGRGIYADYVGSVIEDYELTTFLQTVDDRDVGRNIVLEVRGEDRRFHLDPGANWLLEPAHVSAALAEWQPDVVTVRPGYTGIDLDLETALAPAGDALVLLDVMQPHPSRPHGYLDPALRRATIVHCNGFEARVATGAATIDEAVAVFAAHGIELLLITRGEKGAAAYTRSHRITQPGFSVDVVDVTGSGDAFCAGFIHALEGSGEYLDPETLPRLLGAAQAAGAAAATAVGCVEGVSADLVDRLVAEQGDRVLGDTEIIERE